MKLREIMTPVIVKTPQGDKFAGHIKTINGNPVFLKSVTASKHLQRNMDAWGIDTRVMDTLRERDVCRIRVVSDSGEVYDTFTNIVENHGIHRDFGFGAQVFLPRKYWYRGEPGRFGGRGERYGE